ncbi:hypothetical protein V4U86_22235 [Mycobacterium sp. AMU20-3851]|uniref:hypothetical protein n=1 Tax=Mycobacterium sp. AMU20-3851 TaxID=3122055 RepID=UPI003753F47E
MTYGPPPAAKPPVSGVDIAVSVTALALALVGGAVAAFFGIFFMAFTDTCPPETCDIDAGVSAMFTGFIAAAGLWATGLVVTIAQLVRRSRAWPYAVGTLGLCAAACVLGIAGYLVAVGG